MGRQDLSELDGGYNVMKGSILYITSFNSIFLYIFVSEFKSL